MNTQQRTMPDGYVAISTDDNERYLVPHFMIPATHQAMEVYHQHIELGVQDAAGGVGFTFDTWPMPRMPMPFLWPMPIHDSSQCRSTPHGFSFPCPLLLGCVITDYLILQSSNMNDIPFFLLARDQLMVPPDPVCCPSSCAPSHLHPCSVIDRQRNVSPSCRY